jgi:hypothetical protein
MVKERERIRHGPIEKFNQQGTVIMKGALITTTPPLH